jgi:hypothetical protein
MVATPISCTVQGLSGVPVTVEADVANGLPSPTSVVRLPVRRTKGLGAAVRRALRGLR